jgi:hypothetical protein
VIPEALTAPPAPSRIGGPVRYIGIARAVGALLLVLALVGGSAWYLVYSPFSFRRWSTLEVVPELVIKDPGTYVVYEEFPGAADSTADSNLTISLSSIGGRRVSGTDQIGADGRSTSTYHTPFHEGRAVASFVVDRPGTYRLVAFTSGPGVTSSSAPKLGPSGRPGCSAAWRPAGAGGGPLRPGLSCVVAVAAGHSGSAGRPVGDDGCSTTAGLTAPTAPADARRNDVEAARAARYAAERPAGLIEDIWANRAELGADDVDANQAIPTPSSCSTALEAVARSGPAGPCSCTSGSSRRSCSQDRRWPA